MTTRERIGEYAILKTLGFSGPAYCQPDLRGIPCHHDDRLSSRYGVSTFPAASAFSKTVGAYFPAFKIETMTLYLDLPRLFSVCLPRGDHPHPAGHQDSHRGRSAEDWLMAIPLSYNIRNLWTRRLTTVLTVSGMALVVFVFAAILMLANGLQKTLVETGSYDNVVVLRKGSAIGGRQWRGKGAGFGCRDPSRRSPSVPTDRDSWRKRSWFSSTFPSRGTNKPSNVIVRGIEETFSLSSAPGQTCRRDGSQEWVPRGHRRAQVLSNGSKISAIDRSALLRDGRLENRGSI